MSRIVHWAGRLLELASLTMSAVDVVNTFPLKLTPKASSL